MAENSSPQDLVQKWQERADEPEYKLHREWAIDQCASELEAAYPAWEASVKLTAQREEVEFLRNHSALCMKNHFFSNPCECFFCRRLAALDADPSKETK